jgi:hypothetical protein
MIKVCKEIFDFSFEVSALCLVLGLYEPLICIQMDCLFTLVPIEGSTE